MPTLFYVTLQPKSEPVQALLRVLERAGYRCVCAALEERRSEARERLMAAFESRPPDILLMDLSSVNDPLPLQHTHRLLRGTWGDNAPRPLTLCLLPTALLAQSSHWFAFVDDFLVMPSCTEELLTRLAFLRFRQRHLALDQTLAFADICLIPETRLVIAQDGMPISLRPREYELLLFLMTHQGKFFSRAQLLDFVWGLDFDGGERTVDIHVRRLRAKLPPQASALLQTRRGSGYGFVPCSLSQI